MMRYSIFDPTGNITALVESPVAAELRPVTAAELMRRHPEVEQVGFVGPAPAEDGAEAALCMAGGEFCGNASMSAAALFLLRRGCERAEPETVTLRVSGAAAPVEVTLRRLAADSFETAVRMPAALGIEEREFALGERRGTLPLVRMQGISHLVVEPGSVFFPMRDQRAAAEMAVRDWCRELGAEGLGLMFLERGFETRLTPLVYVPGSGTVFWENSCASGTSAVGMALAEERGACVELTLREPGGTLRVVSFPGGATRLYGQVRFVGAYGEEPGHVLE